MKTWSPRQSLLKLSSRVVSTSDCYRPDVQTVLEPLLDAYLGDERKDLYDDWMVVMLEVLLMGLWIEWMKRTIDEMDGLEVVEAVLGKLRRGVDGWLESGVVEEKVVGTVPCGGSIWVVPRRG